MNFEEGNSRNQADCATGRKNPNSFMGRNHFGYTGYTTVLKAFTTLRTGGMFEALLSAACQHCLCADAIFCPLIDQHSPPCTATYH